MIYDESLQRLMDSLPRESVERLERYLGRCNLGSEQDLRTPFYQAAPREEVIDRLRSILGSAPFEELQDIDDHEASKVGPLSLVLPYSERRSSVQEYWSQTWNPDESCLNAAFHDVLSFIPERSLRPASFQLAFNEMPKDTSLGLPWLTRDRKYAGWYLDHAQRVVSPEDFFPCVLYTRGTASGPTETKNRVVWGFPHDETILGATILYPCLGVLQRRPGFSAWLGESYVDTECTRILHKARGRLIVSGDYSGFDSSLSVHLLDLVDELLMSWFVEAATPRIQLLSKLSNTIGLVVPFEVLVGRDGGMPSGSVLTNLRDTLANLLAMFYCAHRLGLVVDDFMVLGDDCVILFNDDPDVQQLASCMLELGLTFSEEKQFLSTTGLHYLQRWHSLEYARFGENVGIHSVYRSVTGLTGYERFRTGWNKYMDSVRWRMQLENCHNHPQFRVIVLEFYREGDFLGSMDSVTLFKKAGGSPRIREVLDIASFPFNVKNPDRVDEFEITQILRESGAVR